MKRIIFLIIAVFTLTLIASVNLFSQNSYRWIAFKKGDFYHYKVIKESEIKQYKQAGYKVHKDYLLSPVKPIKPKNTFADTDNYCEDYDGTDGLLERWADINDPECDYGVFKGVDDGDGGIEYSPCGKSWLQSYIFYGLGLQYPDFFYRDGAKGKGITIGLIDGGYQQDHLILSDPHEHIQYVDLRDYVGYYEGEPDYTSDIFQKNYCTNYEYFTDYDHGTKTLSDMAAYIPKDSNYPQMGFAPEANYIAVTAYYTSEIIFAVKYLVDNGADIITTGFSFPYDINTYTNSDYYKEWVEAVNYAKEHGVFVLVAAGNNIKSDEINAFTFPSDWVISVGSSYFYSDGWRDVELVEVYQNWFTEDDHLSDSYFDKRYADIFIHSDSIGATATPSKNAITSLLVGTSFSHPKIAALLADYLSENPYITRDEFLEVAQYGGRQIYLDTSNIRKMETEYEKTHNEWFQFFYDSAEGMKEDENAVANVHYLPISVIKDGLTEVPGKHSVSMERTLELTSPEFELNKEYPWKKYNNALYNIESWDYKPEYTSGDTLSANLILPPITKKYANLYIWVELPDGSKYYLKTDNKNQLYFEDGKAPVLNGFKLTHTTQIPFFGDNGIYPTLYINDYWPKGTYKMCGRYEVDGKMVGWHYCQNFEVK